MALEFWFGQFNTVGGAVQEEGPYIGIFEGGADEPDGVGVYVLVEPCGGAGADLCAATIEVIARGFGEPDRALTASLLRALNAAHAYVRRHHPADAAPEFGVGVTVLATRRTEAYIAQAGPALACVRAGGVTKLVEPAGDEAVWPLGSAPRMTPSFSRLQLQPGDSAILLFSAGAQLVERRRLVGLVSQSPEHALPELYLRSRSATDFAALYVAVTGERRLTTTADLSQPPTGRGWTARRPAAEHQQEAAAGTETLVEEPAAAAEQRNGHGGPLLGTVRTITPRRTPLGSMAPVTIPITRGRLAIAGVVAGIALLLLMVLPGLARQGKNDKFNQLVRGADQAIAAAENEPDLAARRSLLAKAQATVEEARTLGTTPGQLTGLEGRLAQQLAEINGVRELSDLAQVADLSAPGLAAPAASQIVVGPSIYVLDATAGKVVALPREGEVKPVTVFEEGRPAGPGRTGRARHIAWWAAEGTRPATLLVLDDQRKLFAIDARGDIRAVALGDTGEWKSDTALAVGTSHLYLLDAAGNQLWRYALNAAGFPGAPEPLLGQRAIIRDATGLSLAGTPVITAPDGRLLRVADGREQVLAPIAMDRPLLAPAPPIPNSRDGLLYLADRGNQRIVRLSPDGTFRGQLIHHRLAGLQAIALDEAEGTLYAIAGQSLVKATIPQ